MLVLYRDVDFSVQCCVECETLVVERVYRHFTVMCAFVLQSTTTAKEEKVRRKDRQRQLKEEEKRKAKEEEKVRKLEKERLKKEKHKKGKNSTSSSQSQVGRFLSPPKSVALVPSLYHFTA